MTGSVCLSVCLSIRLSNLFRGQKVKGQPYARRGNSRDAKVKVKTYPGALQFC